MHSNITTEIKKLVINKLSLEKVGSIVMALNKTIEKTEDKAPSHDEDRYSAWEERLYEIKHLKEYADRLEASIIKKNSLQIEQDMNDFKIAAADFEMIYGKL